MNRKLNWASSILLVLGVGHLALTIVLDRARVANWLGDGLGDGAAAARTERR